MNAVNVRNDPRNQRPVDRPTVYWSERRGTWWTGVGRRCPSCQGALYAVPPGVETRVGFTPGRVSCLLCEREWADVLDVRKPIPPVDEPAPTTIKGRSPVRDPSARPCRDCTGRVAVIDRERCKRCSKTHREAIRSGAHLRRAMTPGVPIERVVLQRILGLSHSGLSSAIERARGNGVPLTTVGRGLLVLEQAS